jgi:hypothetical protein
MPIELTPITQSGAEGYYWTREIVRLTAGDKNFNAAHNLDEDATVADEAVVQKLANLTDAFVDSRAQVLGVTAAGTPPHYIATTDPIFTILQYWASRWGRAQAHLIRGTTGDPQATAEGQMGAMKDEAEKRIDELLLTNVPDEDEPGGFSSVPRVLVREAAGDENSN